MSAFTLHQLPLAMAGGATCTVTVREPFRVVEAGAPVTSHGASIPPTVLLQEQDAFGDPVPSRGIVAGGLAGLPYVSPRAVSDAGESVHFAPMAEIAFLIIATLSETSPIYSFTL